MESPPRPRDALRLLLLGLGALYLGAGPLVSQVLGHKSDLLPQWVMFTGFGLDVCTVDYRQVDEDGGSIHLDRFAVLGYDRPRDAPRSTWRVQSADEADRIGRRMCKKRSGADIRVKARCARRSGWKTERKADTNLCAPIVQGEG